MPIPTDLEEKFRIAAMLAAQRRQEAVLRRQAEAEAKLAAARREREKRRRARPVARAIWSWVSSSDASRLRELGAAASMSSLDLIGTVWGNNGVPSPGLHSGCWELALCTGEVALRFTHRAHPSFGLQRDLHSPAEIAKTIPPAVIFRLASELESGAVWTRLRRNLLYA